MKPEEELILKVTKEIALNTSKSAGWPSAVSTRPFGAFTGLWKKQSKRKNRLSEVRTDLGAAVRQ